jgi:hypothetical protein
MFEMFRTFVRKRIAWKPIHRALPTDPEALVNAIGPYMLKEIASRAPIPGVRKIGLAAFDRLRAEWALYLRVPRTTKPKDLCCCFCGKSQHDVKKTNSRRLSSRWRISFDLQRMHPALQRHSGPRKQSTPNGRYATTACPVKLRLGEKRRNAAKRDDPISRHSPMPLSRAHASVGSRLLRMSCLVIICCQRDDLAASESGLVGPRVLCLLWQIHFL